MSKTLTNNAVNQFDTEVKHAYQAQGILRGTVRTKMGVVGSTHRFPKLGAGIATQRVPQSDVTPMNLSHTNRTATLSDWNAAEYTDIFDQQKVNFSERQELAFSIGGAITRREDQLIIDAINAASTTLTVTTDVGGTGTGQNTAKFRRAKRLLDDGNVGSQMRTYAMSALSLEDMLGDASADTVDKNAVKILVEGEMARWLGFSIVVISSRAEGGLPSTTTTGTNFAWDQRAVGLAVGIEFRTEVNYIPVKTSWLANGLFAAGAVDIDDLGIVEITVTEQ